MSQAQYFIDDQAVEFAAAVRTICTIYDIPQNDLCRFTYLETISLRQKYAKTVRMLPVEVPLPEVLWFDVWDGTGLVKSKTLRLDCSPNPTWDDPRDFGLREMQLRVGNIKVRFWRWVAYREYAPLGQVVHFVHRNDLKRFYRAIHTIEKQTTTNVIKPILPEKKLQEIYDNSIGFLKNWKQKSEHYKKFRIPYKRGILLSGKPGCGKTMTCRWLRELCITNNFCYKIITIEQYRQAQSNGQVSSLFRLSGRGIIFFDDMDVMVKNRKNFNSEIYTFLTEMDGINQQEGVIYVFTTNEIVDLDPAFVRPGRIDVFQIFDHPNDKLRRKFVNKMFDEELLKLIDVNDLVERTDEFSFAEMEEIRKLLAINLIEGRDISMEETFTLFKAHRKEFAERTQFGFGRDLGNDEDTFYDDDDEEESDFA